MGEDILSPTLQGFSDDPAQDSNINITSSTKGTDVVRKN